ncbi:MAG TPA: Flp family type IVb pilin [Tepidisphaeraceae bacterium]|jgi:Flp pilus assembly pilin Flp|nr:Flp family type IVb pilin [Tepidisphaeraceae bacterium]
MMRIRVVRAGLSSLSSERRNAMLVKTLRKLVLDEQGGEVLEYALILGLIVVATVTVITTVGTKVLAKWQGVDSAL